jgi:hypothetical protein
VIIVEGPDGGGKSTLVQTLSQELNFPVAERVVGSDTKPLTDIVKWTENNVSQGFQLVIFDRHRLISEPIYSPFRDGEPPASFLDISWLGDMMWRFYQCKPIIIYALPPLEVVRANVFDPSNDNAYVAEWINHIYAGYLARVSLDGCMGVGKLYNYKTSRIDDLLSWINLQIKQRISDDTSGRVYYNDKRVRLPAPRSSADPSTVSGQRRRTQGGLR